MPRSNSDNWSGKWSGDQFEDQVEDDPLGDVMQWLSQADLHSIGEGSHCNYGYVGGGTPQRTPKSSPTKPLSEHQSCEDDPVDPYLFLREDSSGNFSRKLMTTLRPRAVGLTATWAALDDSLYQRRQDGLGPYQTSLPSSPPTRKTPMNQMNQPPLQSVFGYAIASTLAPDLAAATACCVAQRHHVIHAETDIMASDNEEEEEWAIRQKQTGAAGRIVSYDKGEEPREDLMFRGGNGRRVVVTAVRDSGRAAQAGIKAGDVLASIDGKKDFALLPADVIHKAMTSPVVLVFMGFVGKLQAEVRLNHKTKTCGLSASHQVIMSRPDAPVQVVDEVVFQPSGAGLILTTFGIGAPGASPSKTASNSTVVSAVAAEVVVCRLSSRERPSLDLADEDDDPGSEAIPGEGASVQRTGGADRSGGASQVTNRLPGMPVGGWSARRTEDVGFGTSITQKEAQRRLAQAAIGGGPDAAAGVGVHHHAGRPSICSDTSSAPKLPPECSMREATSSSLASVASDPLGSYELRRQEAKRIVESALLKTNILAASAVGTSWPRMPENDKLVVSLGPPTITPEKIIAARQGPKPPKQQPSSQQIVLAASSMPPSPMGSQSTLGSDRPDTPSGQPKPVCDHQSLLFKLGGAKRPVEPDLDQVGDVSLASGWLASKYRLLEEWHRPVSPIDSGGDVTDGCGEGTPKSGSGQNDEQAAVSGLPD